MDNKNKNPNVPNLRFNFEDDYTTYQLHQFASRVTRKNKNNASLLPLTISAQYGLVDQISFFNKSVASSDLSNYYLLQNGEFAYNKSYSNDYPWGAIKRLDRYDKGCLSTLYICFKPNESLVDTDYLVHYFESPKWYKQVSDIAGEGARNHGLLNIAVRDFFLTKHKFPSLEEQGKVADLLNKIQERIEAQNKIIEDYLSLKKCIINELCNNVDEYTECFVSDISNIGRGRVISSKEINKQLNPKYPVYSSQTSNDGIMGYLDQYDFDGEYITWTTDGANAGTVYYRNGKFNCTNVCGTLKINEENDAFFVSKLLSCLTYSYVSRNLANPKLMNNTMAKIKLKLPPLNKQREFANIIRKIEQKMNYEKEMLRLLKTQKEYFLKNLFI